MSLVVSILIIIAVARNAANRWHRNQNTYKWRRNY
jgi:hypothetical protein